MFEITVIKEDESQGLFIDDCYTAYKIKEVNWEIWVLIYITNEWTWIRSEYFKPN